MSACWVVVPLKRLQDAKQRLSPALAPDARATLARAMLAEVLAVIRQVSGLSGIALVTTERHLVPPGVLWIDDPGAGLNGAIASAAAELERRGATTMLVIPADVPLVTATEIASLVSAGRTSSIVLASDRSRRGTNALLLTPPCLFEPHFGADSFAEHITAARVSGQEAIICDCPGLAFDIDWPRDLGELLERRGDLVRGDARHGARFGIQEESSFCEQKEAKKLGQLRIACAGLAAVDSNPYE